MKRVTRLLVLVAAAGLVCEAPAVARFLPATDAQVGSLADQSPGAPPQAPARDGVPKRSTGTARIRGRVLAADTGSPVRRAIVRVTAPELSDARSTTTDGEGRYEFADLPGGSYWIYASKAGFQMLPYGAKQLDEPGKPLKIADGQTATADLAMVRASAIAGRVLDEFGDPVAGIFVRVARYESVAGTRRLMMMNGSTTNDLGQYRAYGLSPGTYYVSAESQTRSEAESPDRSGYAPTYYPSTPDVTQAQAIQVTGGQDVTSVDIVLAVVRTIRISGTAIDSRGQPIANAGVSVQPVQQAIEGYGGGFPYASLQTDGTFTIRNVPPGEYFLAVTRRSEANTDRPAIEFGRVRVTASGSDISGVVIQSTPGGTISGQVVFEAAAAPPQAKLRVMTIGDDARNPGLPGPTPSEVREDGTFTLTGLFGEQFVRLSGQPRGWVLKGVYLRGRDVTETALSFEGGEKIAGLQIVLTDRVTHLSVTINENDDQPADAGYVLIFADDPSRWPSGSSVPGSRYWGQSTTRGGAPAKSDGLPPADYVAVALKTIQGLDVRDPAFLERMRRTGTKFSLAEGESKSLTLKFTDPSAK